jgi:hypothetical protein
MQIKDLIVQDQVLRHGRPHVSFTIETPIDTYHLVEALDQRYRIDHRDKNSSIMRYRYGGLRQYLSQLGVSIDKLFVEINKLISKERNKGSKR